MITNCRNEEAYHYTFSEEMIELEHRYKQEKLEQLWRNHCTESTKT